MIFKSNMDDNKFAQHIYFDRPREGAPSFVKGRMSMRRDDAVKYLQSLPVSEKGYVYFDLLASKDNSKLYFKVNEYKPKTEAPVAPESPGEEVSPNDIPF